MAQASVRTDDLLVGATVRAPATAEPAESLAVASGGSLGSGAHSPAQTGELVA